METDPDRDGPEILPYPSAPREDKGHRDFKTLRLLCPALTRRTFHRPSFSMISHTQHRSKGRRQQTNAAAMASGSAEFRTMVRHSLQARVVFHWNDQDGSQKAGRGRTRNISQKGAYVVSLEHPPKGAQVSLSIYLPPLPGDTRVLSIEAKGKVLRVESKLVAKDSPGWGFAVSNHQVILSTN
jgi:hypothetical protein